MTVKKTIRRRNALARFTVMSAEQFATSGNKGTYPQYIERKDIERQSLLYIPIGA